MQLKDEQPLGKPRAEVWAALNNSAVLKRSIPGCDTFELEEQDRYKIGVVVAVGPIKARFNGRLHISDIEDNVGYSLTFEGSGGTAGFGKGTAKVQLSDIDSGTLLSYTVDAEVGGKLAQVGSRLIDGVARRKAKEFFGSFANLIEGNLPDDETVEGGDVKGATRSQGEGATQSQSAPEHPQAEHRNNSLPGSETEKVSRSYIAMISTLAASVAVLAASVAVLAAAVVIGVGLR